jgi:WD40 repeat protein
MGICSSSRANFVHEPLNEYDVDYDVQLACRNSLEARKPLLWRRFGGMAGGRQISDEDEYDEPIENTSSAQNKLSSSMIGPHIPVADPVLTSPETSTHYQSALYSRRAAKTQHPLSQLIINDGREKYKVSDDTAHQRLGHAFQIRLEKHRLIQLSMASPGQITASTISPSSMDSGFASTHSRDDSSFRRVREITPTSNEFARPTNPWNDFSRKSKVTAVAIASGQVTISSKNQKITSTLLALGDDEGTLNVTRLSGTEPFGPFGNEIEVNIDGRIRGLHFTNSGKYIVAGGDGCSAWIFRVMVDGDTSVLKELLALYKFDRPDRVYDVKFSPDNSTLAVGGFDGKITFLYMDSIWSNHGETTERAPSTMYLNRSDLVYCLGWNPSGQFLAVGGSNRTCSVYRIHGLDSACVYESDGKSTAIESLQWSPDGKHLAFGHSGVDILTFDDEAHTFTLECCINQTSSTDLAFRYRVLSMCWNASSTYLVFGASDGTCSIVETESYTEVLQARRDNGILSMHWVSNLNENQAKQNYLALADGTPTLAFLKLRTDIQDSKSIDVENDSIDTSSDQTNESTSELQLTNSEWILQEDMFQTDDSAESSQESPKISADAVPTSPVQAIAFSKKSATRSAVSQSTYLAYACGCALTIMTTRNWKVIFQIEFEKPIRTISFSSSSNHLALGGDEGVLYVLSVPSRSLILNTILGAQICSIAFSKEDARLSVGLDDGKLSLFVVDADWEPTADIDRGDSPVICHEWSTDALALGRMDGTVCIYDAEQVMLNHFQPMNQISCNGPIRSLSFSARGQFLSIVGETGLVSILSCKGGWVVCNQMDFGCGMLTTAWSPGGRYLVLGGTGLLIVMDTFTWTSLGHEVDPIVQSILSTKADDDDGDGTVVSIYCADWSLDSKYIALGSSFSGINVHVTSTHPWSLIDLSSSRSTKQPHKN